MRSPHPQLLKRVRLSKLPLQANYYPVPSQMYIEDDTLRLTLVTGQPLGGSSLEPGQMEIMQDRRLRQDDNRGLGQGVQDNQPVLNMFRLILENVEPCVSPLKPVSIDRNAEQAGFLTATANLELKSLLHPVEKLIWSGNEWTGVQSNFGGNRQSVSTDMEVAVMRDLSVGWRTAESSSVVVVGKPKSKRTLDGSSGGGTIGLVVRRNQFQMCPSDAYMQGSVSVYGHFIDNFLMALIKIPILFAVKSKTSFRYCGDERDSYGRRDIVAKKGSRYTG